MFSVETTALLRAVLEEVCEDIPVNEVGVRTNVAPKILEAARRNNFQRMRYKRRVARP
jgi:hypothetical protein